MEIKDVSKNLWGVELLRLDFSKEFICDSQIAAILLACNSESFARFARLEKFKEIFKTLNLELNKYNIQSSQAGILLGVSRLKIRRSDIILALKELKSWDILSAEFFELLNDFLLSFNFDEISLENTANKAFHKNLDALNQIAQGLKELCDEILAKRLENAVISANNSTFNIAVSGVINAGKSSLLNALISQNLLGVSNIPQTASICVLKYASKPFAMVEFLKPCEQKDLPQKTLENKEVDFSELKSFTAADSELAKYVKCCTLGLNSEILKDINIIDTPGIDDAVIKREELSREYLKNCDSVIYLMNSAQACTKKDMDFLKNIVLNTKNSEILVVLSHIDKLSASEQESVLEYTQKSIFSELNEINEELSKNIKYFLVSALENIGINELKAYIFESFFGQNSKKATLVLSSFKKEISLILSELLDSFEKESRAFSLASILANDEILALKAQREKELENLEKANAKITEIFKQIADIKIDIQNDIAMISSKIADRVINEAKYKISKKEKLDQNRLFTIANSAFKDFLIDLLREQKQGLEQKLQSFSLVLNTILSDFNFKMPEFKSYLDEIAFEPDFTSFKEYLNLGSDLQKANNELVENSKKFLLDLNLTEQISALFSAFSKEFKENLSFKFSELKAQSQAKHSRILKALNDANSGNAELSLQKEKCLKSLKTLNELKERLEQC